MLIKFANKQPHGAYTGPLCDYVITYTQNKENFVVSLYKPLKQLDPIPIVGITTDSIAFNIGTTPIIETKSIFSSINPNFTNSTSDFIGLGTTVNFNIDYSDVKNLSEDFGIISFSINYNTKICSLISLTEKTYIEKQNFADYHNEKKLIPLIVFFTPYKGCEFSDCNIVIHSNDELSSSINFDTSTIIFDETINSLTNYSGSDNCWGTTSNYPTITGPSTSKVGIQTSFFVNVPNNAKLYLETNMGTLNKIKITKSTDIVLDLSSVTNFDEDAIIKVSSKYWSGLCKHTINLIE